MTINMWSSYVKLYLLVLKNFYANIIYSRVFALTKIVQQKQKASSGDVETGQYL